MTYFELFVKGVAVAAALVSAVFLAAGLYGRWRYHTDLEETAQSVLPPLAIMALAIWALGW